MTRKLLNDAYDLPSFPVQCPFASFTRMDTHTTDDADALSIYLCSSGILGYREPEKGSFLADKTANSSLQKNAFYDNLIEWMLESRTQESYEDYVEKKAKEIYSIHGNAHFCVVIFHVSVARRTRLVFQVNTGKMPRAERGNRWRRMRSFYIFVSFSYSDILSYALQIPMG